MSALRLYGVTSSDEEPLRLPLPDARLVAYRDLAAVVSPASFVPAAPTEDAVDGHAAVVESVFRRRTVVPAPFGVTFRSQEVLLRWLELHYSTIGDALHFVDGRVEARVHLARGAAPTPVAAEAASGGKEGPEPDDLEFAAAADAVLRLLRPLAAATTKLRDPSPRARCVALLVDRERWDALAAAVQEARSTDRTLVVRLTGPWPPYDFVRLQFEG